MRCAHKKQSAGLVANQNQRSLAPASLFTRDLFDAVSRLLHINCSSARAALSACITSNVHTGALFYSLSRPFVGRAAAQTIIPHFPFYGIINYCTHQINTYSNIFNDGASPFSGSEIIYDETQTLLPRSIFNPPLCGRQRVWEK
jgi:hypothetical protein